MITLPDIYRPSPKYPTYPPYHTGLYMEDYFYEWAKGKEFKRQYIPIFWTTIYCDQLPINIQGVLDRLPRDGKYFTICQHDDAPKEQLPLDTMIFAASSRVEYSMFALKASPQMIPIPLICSPIINPLPREDKDYFCSFVGADTSPVRTRMIKKWMNHPDYTILSSGWTPTVSQNSANLFKNITRRSTFALCPRGYGKSSFRLYEALQLGAIPVIISDCEHWLPWSDEIRWDNLAVLVKDSEIDQLDNILKSVPSYKRTEMIYYAKDIYDKYFSLPGMCENIMKCVNI